MNTPLRNPIRGLPGVYNLIEVISSWTEQKLRSIVKYILYFGILKMRFLQNMLSIMYCNLPSSEKIEQTINRSMGFIWLVHEKDRPYICRYPTGIQDVSSIDHFVHSCFGHSTISATLYKDHGFIYVVLCVIYNNIMH